MILLLCFFGTSCAQQRGISKVYAFKQLISPGNIAVDDRGEPLAASRPHVVHTVYVETSGDAPTWVRGYYGGHAYTLYTALIEEKKLDIGRNKADEKPVSISVKSGNRLWQLTLEPDTSRTKLPTAIKMEKDEIILEGTYKGKPFTRKMGKPVELSAPEYM